MKQGTLKEAQGRKTRSTRQARRSSLLMELWRRWSTKEKGAVKTTPDNEGRFVPAWIDVKGGLQLFAICFSHSEGWSQRNEALSRSSHKADKADAKYIYIYIYICIYIYIYIYINTHTYGW